MAIRIPVITKEEVTIDLLPIFDGGTQLNPTLGATVQTAYMASGQPEEDDWKDAGFISDATEPIVLYSVRTMVGGPDTGAAAELEAGSYRVWVRINSPSEVPIFPVDRLEMYS